MTGPSDSSSTSSFSGLRPHRFAIFGLLDTRTAHMVRPLQEEWCKRTQNAMALLFPVHVTVRGRFLATEREAIGAFRNLHTRLDCQSPLELCLAGPVFRPPDLLWLEVEPGSPGQKALAALHRAADQACREVMTQDEVSVDHSGDGYRPHVTLAWGASEQTLIARPPPTTRIACHITRVALARYPDGWPRGGAVELVEVPDRHGANEGEERPVGS